ncbi:MAG: Nif3-like dinuclear metal center hexameric protein [Limnochordia bacterium]|nr:Nif3-like dinuclear metal center hexameric protein [Limnochordia bacterium]
MRISDIATKLESLAPISYAEKWDNVGLLIGDPRTPVERLLVTLDVDADSVQYAIEQGCSLIIAHHPLIFKPIPRINQATELGRLISVLLKHDIGVYVAHTNMDAAREGLGHWVAELYHLQNVRILSATQNQNLYKIVVYVPVGSEDKVRDALIKGGAGHIGNYSHCTFQVLGTGTFLPLEGTSPYIGSVGSLERVDELRLETIVPGHHLHRALSLMMAAHPYEEVAYDVYKLENRAEVGIGRIGHLPKEMTLRELAEYTEEMLHTTVRVSGQLERPINKVAICPGSGGNLVHTAGSKGADVFVTGDIKYHEALEAQARGLALIDAGHRATELPFVERVACYLQDEAISVYHYVPKERSVLQTLTMASDLTDNQ